MMARSFTIRQTTDKQELFSFLQRDPIYSAYAIGDLEPTLYLCDCEVTYRELRH